MKKYVIYDVVAILAFLFFYACSPADYSYADNDTVEIDSIGQIVLIPEHTLLQADGRAQIDLRPLVYLKDGSQVPDTRINEEWLEYTSESGVKIVRHFSTSDASLIGQKMRVRVKGRDITSGTVEFEIIKPADPVGEITIPVVFHVLQTREDVESYGGTYDAARINQLLDKLNNTFSGGVSMNPVGVDTRIRFKAALYDPLGKKMFEPGIHRLTVTEIYNENKYADFLADQGLVWPVNQYMNIWLISDRLNEQNAFGKDISATCRPLYMNPGTDPASVPQGLDLRTLPGEGEIAVSTSGVMYKLQLITALTWQLGESWKPGDNELIHYVGHYLGLLPTFTYEGVPDDYCEDTHNYNFNSSAYQGNKTLYKTANDCFFRSENIMDDPTGLHRSVSKNQSERIRWVLNNCPERSAWKSDFALTGR